MEESSSEVEKRFLREVRHHIGGWKNKIAADFSEAAYQKELQDLCDDSVYRRFAFNHPTYVLIRLMGRMSISIGRRLGEIYDKVPRFVTQARFRLTSQEVAPKIRGELNLDIRIPFAAIELTDADRAHIIRCAESFGLGDASTTSGLGIEIRYNFNPNDSARLRKDVTMAQYLSEDRLVPVYLIFSSISPRNEAIERLQRAGWKFLVGNKAIEFMRELVQMDFETILDRPAVQQEIASEVSSMMKAILSSNAFTTAVKDIYKPSDEGPLSK